MKRFIDDHIWLDPWFNQLSSDEKLLWIYLFTNCDKIGLWEENIKEVEYRLHKKLNWDKLKERFSEKIMFIGSKWHIKNFINIQYPRMLSLPNAPLHVSIFNELNKKGLKLAGNSLYIDYAYTMYSLQVKEEVREEVRENLGKSENPLWRENSDAGYAEYLRISEPEWDKIQNDWNWIELRKEFYPGVCVKKTLDKMWLDFWGTKAGWQNKRSKKTKTIDWEQTIINNFQKSRVFYAKTETDYEAEQIKRMKENHEI